MKYSRDQRRQIARAFDFARVQLKNGKSAYICLALEKLPRYERHGAVRVVRDRLKGHYTLGSWLVAQGIPWDEVYDDLARQRAHRVAWLEKLIDEFTA